MANKPTIIFSIAIGAAILQACSTQGGRAPVKPDNAPAVAKQSEPPTKAAAASIPHPGGKPAPAVEGEIKPVAKIPAVEPAPVAAPPVAPPAIARPSDPKIIVIPSGDDAANQQALGPFSAALSQDLTINQENLWERIRNGFNMPAVPGPVVAEYEQWYTARPDYLKRMVDRSKRYLHYIVEEVERRNMPTEIALLPMIESAFNPTAYSRSHASGIWQFIPSTGKYFGLQQNWWHDDRRDVIAATNAALDYLSKLYEMFGSWDLALAAYNSGEGTVSRAIARNAAKNLPTDYPSLNLPPETRHYLPKLQAVKNVVANPTLFGLELSEIPNEPYFTTVAAPQKIDVKVAAKLAEVPLEEFISLNPAFNRPMINSDGSRLLLLPVDKAEAFSTNLDNHKKPLASWRTYVARKGERLDKIAAKFGISTNQLREINGLSRRTTKASAGPLLVPLHLSRKTIVTESARVEAEKNKPATKSSMTKVVLATKEKSSARDAPSSRSKTPAASGPLAKAARQLLYIVQKGDTLFSISQRYNVTVAQLKSWNNLRSSRLSLGQKLVLKPGSGDVATSFLTVVLIL
ncbi:MAG: transglycosylase SLT domain-containing protein [Burkholderiales bacterium]|nr:transglycosylase SLT domain-containing protein [Burkholderiales bacterium]